MTDQEIIRWLKNKKSETGNTLFEYIAKRFKELAEKEKQ